MLEEPCGGEGAGHSAMKLSLRCLIILSMALSVRENNVGVWALKRNASMLDAQNDFNKLDEMFRLLHYFQGFFINIDSNSHHLELYSGNYKDRIFAFAVNLSDNTLHIKQASFMGERGVSNPLLYDFEQQGKVPFSGVNRTFCLSQS